MITPNEAPVREAFGLKWFLLGMGLFLTFAAVTLAFFAMRSIMEVGGTCASGGPYAIRQQCPDTAWVFGLAFPLGAVGIGCIFGSRLPTRNSYVLLAWSAIFLALGANFVIYGINPPAPATGIQWGWLSCAFVFLPMGGLPLLYLIFTARESFWTGRVQPRRTRRTTQMSAMGVDINPLMAAMAEAMNPTATIIVSNPSGPVETSTINDGPGDISERLTRLAELHSSGALTDEEFSAAKSKLLSEGSAS